MKVFKRLLYTAIILVIISVIADYLIVAPSLERRIMESVQHIEHRSAGFSQIRTRIITGTVSISDLYFESLTDSNKGRLDISIDKIKLARINVFKFIFGQDISIGKVKISGCRMDADIPAKNKQQNPLVLISDRKINVGSAEIKTDTVRVRAHGLFRETLLTDASVELHDINISTSDTVSLNHIARFSINLPESVLKTTDGNITCYIHKARYDSGMLSVDSATWQPNFSDYAYTNRFDKETDRIDAKLKAISVENIQFKELLSGSFICSNVKLKHADVNIFRDKRKPDDEKIKPAIQEMIRNFPGRLSVDSVSIYNGRVTYKEHMDDAANAGYLQFTGLKLTVLNLTNNNRLLTSGVSLTIKGEARLMGTANINIELKTPLFDTNNTIIVKGSMDKFNMDDLNPMLTHQASIKAQGNLDSMNFRFIADNNRARGNLLMVYKNLQVTVTDEHGKETNKLNQRIKTFFANKQLINSNPPPGHPIKAGTIRYERDPRKFIINYSFKSILSGIQSTILVNPPVEIQE